MNSKSLYFEMELFSTNLKVLVIHHDTVVLNEIQEMCDRYHYVVTKCTSASYAFNLLVERCGYFDMMLIDVCIANMDSYSFVQYVTLQHKIPVIVISSDATKSSVLKSIIHGACDYWVQPLHEKQFKTMWQHVVRKTLMENKEDEDPGFLNAQLHKEPGLVEILETDSHKEHHDLGFLKVRSAKEPELVEILETESHKEDEVLGFLEPQSHQEHEVFGIMEGPRHERKREREDDKAGKERGAKKSRLSWTPELHQQFVNAVNQLGVDEAKPRKILKMMGVSGLATAQVASHLQKYRNYLKRPKSKKSPTWLEFEYAKSMIEQDQSPQLNSTLQTDNIYETQQHTNDVTTNYHQVSDIGCNYETQKLSTDVGDYGVSDIMNDFPDSTQSMLQQDLNSTLQSDNNYETQQHPTDVGDYRVSDIMNNDFPDPSDLLFDLDDELISLIF
ncbi:hypothetical protein KIW84_076529 [Lathyrus oleraceus]|uniref:Uncharacterized protein n=2 Tax=Pisum sativum TaxID=3888 RepID=A0A9D5A1A8_PEA|nr:hypothetical protein KIW84_076529 [Pisum sativum]